MSLSASVNDSAGWSPHSRVLSTMLIIMAAFIVALLGIAALEWSPLIIVALFGAVAGLSMIRWPDLTTLVVIGLIYTNLPVVAVNFHGAPEILPAAVLAMLAWPLAYHLLIRGEPFRLLSASPFLGVFAVVQLIGVFGVAREPASAFSHFVSFLFEGVAVYLLVTNLVRTRHIALACFWVLAFCAVLMGGVPLFQQATGTFENTYGGLAQADSQFAAEETAALGVVRQQRAAGTIGEQNRYAQFMILLAPIGLSLIAMATSRQLKLAAIAATFAALFGFALAFSRGAAVGLVMALGIAAWMRLVSGRQIKMALIGAAVVLLLLPQYVTRLSSIGALAGIVEPGEASLHQADGATRGRLTEMGAALMVFRDHPLFGVGPGMFKHYSQEYGQLIGLRPLDEGRQAHSMPLGIAAEHGLLGLLAMTGLIAMVGHKLVRSRQVAIQKQDTVGQQLTTGMLLMIILYLTTGLFLHLSYIRYFWLIIALGDSIASIVAREDSSAVFGDESRSVHATHG